MLARLRKFCLKWIYRTLIYKSIVVDKEEMPAYLELENICAMNVDTEKGPFVFLFKRDRRTSPVEKIPYISNYIIELDLPEGLMPKNTAIRDKLVIVVKMVLFKPDYRILIEILTEIYLDRILNFIDAQDQMLAR